MSVVLSKMLIYLVLIRSRRLSSPALFFYCIPLTHHSSSHRPPLPPVSLSLFLCSHFCLSNMSPSVFFFLSMSVLILPDALLLLPTALPRPWFCCCNDTDKLFGHGLCLSSACYSCLFFIHLFPSLCHFLSLDPGTSNVNLDGHKDCRTPTEHTHTPCLH